MDFVVDQPVYQILYNLDGQENVSINGNTTILSLPSGLHDVIVYARGNYTGEVFSSENVTFTVAVPEPFSFAQTAAVSAAVLIAVTAGLLVYFKKRKHQSIPSSTISNNK